jgi:hypothetical protein
MVSPPPAPGFKSVDPFYTTVTDPLARIALRILGGSSPKNISEFDDWIEHSSHSEGFTVKFPGAPRQTGQDLTDNPVYSKILVTAFVGDPQRTLVASCLEAPHGLADTERARQQYISNVMEAYFNRGAFLVERRSWQLESGMCNDATLLYRSSSWRKMAWARIRAFASTDRLYGLCYEGQDASDRELEIAAFFLDSFSVAGGCAESSTPPGAGPIERSVDPGVADPTGWQRFRTSYGIKFLLPGPANFVAQLKVTDIHVPPYYGYTFQDAEYYFVVQIFDQNDPEQRNSPDALEHVIHEMFAQRNAEYEAEGIVLENPRPIAVDGIAGREWDVWVVGEMTRGRFQIFATPTRTFVLLGTSYETPDDDWPLHRFFHSIALELD